MLVVLNNKCNLDYEEFINYNQELNSISTNIKLVLCPSMLYVSLFKSDKIILGSQKVDIFDMGAYTGCVNAKQLKSLGVKYSLVGHSEVRKYKNITRDEINKKIKKLLEEGITPIYCIGETQEERNNNTYKELLKEDILESLKDLTNEEKKKVIVAYEPVWSIGTGNIPKCYEINEVVGIIKEELPNNRILYGGSVNEENINFFNTNCNLDGYLLGGVSLKINKLQKLLNILEK
ncbi:MAG: triosephosphate isomerase [Bacilli bacterium]|nr:triosephosphate isomerase [Bacilli bacterium]